MQAPPDRSRPQLDSSTGTVYFPSNRTRVDLYGNVAANLKLDQTTSQYGQFQPMSAMSKDTPTTDAKGGS